jgi:hypothetical protein
MPKRHGLTLTEVQEMRRFLTEAQKIRRQKGKNGVPS